MSQQKPNDGHPTASPQPVMNYCFGCGKDNPDGMKLQFYLDEKARHTICEFTLSRRYQGPPGHAHGGIIATILDEAMGKVNKLHKVVALTKDMKVEYLRPVPLNQKLTVIGREHEITGGRHINVAEIRNENNEVLARSTGTFVPVDMKRFASFVKSEPAS